MTVCQKQYHKEFKKNSVKITYISLKSVRALDEDLEIAENVLFNVRKNYVAEGSKTPMATLE